jgi:hypothetical protein
MQFMGQNDRYYARKEEVLKSAEMILQTFTTEWVKSGAKGRTSKVKESIAQIRDQ